MSSTLAKNFEHKLTVALKDARVAALNTKNNLDEEGYFGEIESQVINLDIAMFDDSAKNKKAVVDKLMGLLLNYEIKFL
jgi:hypothetical protein